MPISDKAARMLVTDHRAEIRRVESARRFRDWLILREFWPTVLLAAALAVCYGFSWWTGVIVLAALIVVAFGLATAIRMRQLNATDRKSPSRGSPLDRA